MEKSLTLGLVLAVLLLPDLAYALPDGSVGGNCTGCHEARPPATPSGFSASESFTDRVRLTWSDPSPSWTIGYDLFRSTGAAFPGGSPWATLGPYAYPNGVASRTYDDFSAGQGTQYYYWVRAWNAGFASGTASNPGRRIFPPDLSCTPASISRTVVVGNNATSATLTCTNEGEGSLAYSITDNRTYISVSPASASGLVANESQNHTVSFPSAALALGSYSGQITVDGGAAGTHLVSVSLTVQPPPDLSCTPQVSVSRLAGVLTNASFSCTNNGGGSVSYTLTETPAAPWLTVNPTSGSNVGANQSRSHSLVFDPNLTPGTYTATLHYDAGTAGSGDVAVTLEVETSVYVLRAGDLLVTDRNNGRVLRVDLQNGIVSTFSPRAGTGNELVAPAGIGFSESALYVADSVTNHLVAIDPVTGEQTAHTDGSGPVALGSEPWGLDFSNFFATSVSPASQQVHRTYLVYGTPTPAVNGGSALLADAHGIAALSLNNLVVAGGSAGLVSVDQGAVSLITAPTVGDQAYDVERDGAGWAWTELSDDCVDGALFRDVGGPPLLVSSGSYLRCPVSLAVGSDAGGWVAYVGDTLWPGGGSARVIRVRDTGTQSFVVQLPPGVAPTRPAGIAIAPADVIPEPGGALLGLGALLALFGLSRRRSGTALAARRGRMG